MKRFSNQFAVILISVLISSFVTIYLFNLKHSSLPSSSELNSIITPAYAASGQFIVKGSNNIAVDVFRIKGQALILWAGGCVTKYPGNDPNALCNCIGDTNFQVPEYNATIKNYFNNDYTINIFPTDSSSNAIKPPDLCKSGLFGSSKVAVKAIKDTYGTFILYADGHLEQRGELSREVANDLAPRGMYGICKYDGTSAKAVKGPAYKTTGEKCACRDGFIRLEIGIDSKGYKVFTCYKTKDEAENKNYFELLQNNIENIDMNTDVYIINSLR